MSRLSLSDGELKIGYTRYLIIKELCPTEIALLILSKDFQYRRENAYTCFFSYTVSGINQNKKALLLLDSLEDRFLNPVVIAMLAELTCVSDRIRHEEMRKARDLLRSRKEEELSMIELYFKGRTLDLTYAGSTRDRSEIIRIYEICVINNFLPSFNRLICRLYTIRHTAELEIRMMDVMEKGVALGCYSCINLLANHLYIRHNQDMSSTLNDDKHPVAVMNIKAAQLGETLAINRCESHGWDYK